MRIELGTHLDICREGERDVMNFKFDSVVRGGGRFLAGFLGLFLWMIFVVPAEARSDFSWDKYRQAEYDTYRKKIKEEVRGMEEEHLSARKARSIAVGDRLRVQTSRAPSKNYRKAVSKRGRVDQEMIEKDDKQEEKVDKGGHRLLICTFFLALLGGVVWLVRRLTQE